MVMMTVNMMGGGSRCRRIKEGKRKKKCGKGFGRGGRDKDLVVVIMPYSR